jgi:hypothetical protein
MLGREMSSLLVLVHSLSEPRTKIQQHEHGRASSAAAFASDHLE